MAGPASPGTEGPTFEPPQLPPGWIAQWDGNSRKYYYVQLATGHSQWDTPTEAAPGGTPAQGTDHPYGVPGQQEIITHPDGSQTIKHADGRMEPVLAPEGGSRGIDGPNGERGFGQFAANALLNQVSGQHSRPSGGSGSNPLGSLAGQVISGITHSGGGQSSSGGNGAAGKLVGALASQLFSSGNDKPQPQNYHGGVSTHQQHQSGFGGMMGNVANMFGGSSAPTAQSYGYSNSGQSGGYSGQAPPTSYQPPSAPPSQQSQNASHPNNQHGASSYNHTPTQQTYPPPAGQQQYNQYNSPPPGQQSSYAGGPPSQGSQPYGQSPASHGQHSAQHSSYNSPAPSQPSYSAGGQQYPPPSSGYNPAYGNIPPPPSSSEQSYPGQSTYGSQGGNPPPVPSGTHPHHGQQGQHGPPGGYAGNWQ